MRKFEVRIHHTLTVNTLNKLVDYNSPSNWAIELFKPSKDVESPVVMTRNNVGKFWILIFCQWCHNRGRFRHFLPPSSGPGSNPKEKFFFFSKQQYMRICIFRAFDWSFNIWVSCTAKIYIFCFVNFIIAFWIKKI